MANITRIKAGGSSAEKEPKDSGKAKKVVREPKKALKTQKVEEKPAKNVKNTKKTQEKSSTSEKKIFILFRPFVALGRYLRDSWREIRQVRWPSRKATWKMFFAVLIYALLFVVIIVLLDLFFTWLFNLILGNK